MKFLITAFEPFAEAQTNSSWIIFERLRAFYSSDKNFVFAGPVPVTFSGAWPFVRDQIQANPSIEGLLCLGQAETRTKISLERVALNCIDARIADNAQDRPKLSEIESGPDVLWSSIPWEKLPDSPLWERSYSAGTFVCNALMYQSLSWAQQSQKRAGFVHIPALSSQTEISFQASPKMQDDQAHRAMVQVLEFLNTL